MNNDIAIIGGSGFVGTRLAKMCSKFGLKYTICDIVVPEKNYENNYLDVDIESVDSLKQLEGFNCIVNLAAEHRDDVRPVSRYDDVNVEGAKKLCNSARKFNINKIIFTSSVAIYGFAEPDADEDSEINYFNDYGRTKFQAEEIYKKWFLEDQVNRTLVIVRPTVIFGENNRGNVFNLFNQIASKRFVIFGKGENKKSMAYVENVAAFLKFSLDFNPGKHIYNYVDKPDLTMNQLAKIARKAIFKIDNCGLHFPGFIGLMIGRLMDIITLITKKSFPISEIRVRKFMATTQFSTRIGDSGYIAPMSLEDGLKRTLEYEFGKESKKQEK